MGLFVAGARRFPGLLETALDDREVGEGQLAGDHIVVAHGIDGAHHVHDVGIVETANHVDDGVDFADV